MRYSIYRYPTRSYDYYEDGRTSATHAGAPPVRGRSELGATPEQVAWVLPAGARKVGSGEFPIGRVATDGAGAALGDLTAEPMKLGMLALVAFVAWRTFR